MKKNYVYFLVASLFICSSLFPSVIGICDDEFISSSNGINSIYLDDDVPIWELGDIWVYNIDDVDFIDESGVNTMTAHLEFGDLTLEVEDVTSSSYILSFNVKLNGDFEIYSDDYLIELTGRISRLFATKIDGGLSVRKSDLSIEEINIDLTSLLRVKITEQSFVPIPIPALFVPLRVNLNCNFQDTLPIINFPLSVEKTWTLPSITFSIDGQIRSIWLNIVNFVVRIVRIFGIDIIPPEIASLLPRIDIGNLITALKGDNIVFINSSIWQETPLLGVDTFGDVTVPAGTFSAYNIILPISLGNLYYSPEVGNIVKMTIGSLDAEINMELKDTNYS